jgi:hypothetical protein
MRLPWERPGEWLILGHQWCTKGSRFNHKVPEMEKMTAQKIEIRTIGNPQPDALVLTLKQFTDGWSYEVQDLESGPLALPWRAETMQAAEEKLKASYDSAIWDMQILEEG